LICSVVPVPVEQILGSRSTWDPGFDVGVNELNEHGIEGVPAHSVLPAEVGHDAGKGKPHNEKSGAAYALVMQITGSEQQLRSTPSMHGGFYEMQKAGLVGPPKKG
jgi:hypothetical protein